MLRMSYVGRLISNAHSEIFCQRMLSGGILCVGLISRPEQPNRLRFVCDCEASKMRRSLPTSGCCTMEYIYMYIFLYV